MAIVTVGIDLAKNVFAIHGVDEAGKAMLVKPKVSRDQLVPLIAQLPPCLIGMELVLARITGRGCFASTDTRSS
ncbi:hypothetical protein AWV80_33300 [Cupriavidus sp. UYMU48A]|nr:hypothetical protein AWV80_33300 [Cupriavidus sp. UYMU48A]